MLTYSDAQRLGVEHALHGSPGSELSLRFLINSAGKHLVGMHRWAWLERPLTPVSLVGGQDFIQLPDDVQDVIDLKSNGLVNFDVRRSNMAEIQYLRQHEIQTVGGVFYWAPTYRNPGGDPTDPRSVQLVLAVYSTPSDDATDALLLQYRAGWADVLAGESEKRALPLPADGTCDMLYLQILRAVARGFEEDDKAEEGRGPTMDRRLAEIEVGPVFLAAKRADTRRVENRGRITNGLVAQCSEAPHVPRLFLDRPVTDYQAL